MEEVVRVEEVAELEEDEEEVVVGMEGLMEMVEEWRGVEGAPVRCRDLV